jgi:hypothetical protein
MSTEMDRPTEALEELRRAVPVGDNATYARTARLTLWALKELVEWIDHLEVNQIQVMPVDQVPRGYEILHNGEWRRPRQILGEGLVATCPPQKQTAEDIVLAEMSFTMADDKEPTADDLGHGRARDIAAALREAGLLKEPDE